MPAALSQGPVRGGPFSVVSSWRLGSSPSFGAPTPGGQDVFSKSFLMIFTRFYNRVNGTYSPPGVAMLVKRLRCEKEAGPSRGARMPRVWAPLVGAPLEGTAPGQCDRRAKSGIFAPGFRRRFQWGFF